MTKDDGAKKSSRRQFLTLLGAGAFGTGLLARKGEAMPTFGPYTVSGHRIHQYDPDGDRYVHNETFTSDELKSHYGDSVVEFDTDSVPREIIPDEYKDPDTSFTLEWDDTAQIGTYSEFYQKEQRYAPGPEPKSVIGGGGGGSGLPTYYGAKYVYKKSVTQLEATSPINVGWLYYNGSASDIRSTMKNDFGELENWDSIIAGKSVFSRYIISENGNVRKTEAEVGKVPTGAGSFDFSQWHVRLWNFSSDESNGYPVIGQAHYDTQYHGILDDPEFQFANSRRRVLSAWRDNTSYTTTNQDIYNGTGYPQSNTSDGKFGIIHY